ncbi:unnamed protein product [Citrullus colocynthis]|uniref:Oxidoreductase N-terminal domain-containing protein n=1 Tax=Citrullus colocynthis TaxID=252529 RepID=A0ABP0ZA10_9ROSI
MEEVKNKFITLKHHISRFPVDSDFELLSQILHLFTKPASAQIVLENLFVSIDPCQINRMKTHHSSHDTLFATNSIIPGYPITAHGVAEVVAADDPEFEKGDLVEGAIHWALYSVVKPGPTSPLNKLNTLGFPLINHLGTLINLDHPVII